MTARSAAREINTQGAGYLDQDQAVDDDKVGSAPSCVMRISIHITNLGTAHHHSTRPVEFLLVITTCNAVLLG